MQRDFHYYCIAVLARAAGFNKKDATIIAYASQYTDDATESELVRLALPGADLRFDPVRTAYSGLEMAGALTWSAQKRVYIPFHFIPSRPFAPRYSKSFSFVTQPATSKESFAAWLLQQAQSEPLANHRRRLCRIGIALHTFADTWAHQRFSGRHNRDENDVENICVWADDDCKRLKLENLLLDALPQIGHAEAGYFPDLSFQKWGYDSRHESGVERDNRVEFFNAAQAIYDALAAMEKTEPDDQIPWLEIAPDIRRLFEGKPVIEERTTDRLSIPAYRRYHASDLDERCKRWQATFGPLFPPYAYNYDPMEWRQQALDGDTDWDRWSQRDWDRMPVLGLKAGFWNSLWVHFHRAALRQRHLVLENLP